MEIIELRCQFILNSSILAVENVTRSWLGLTINVNLAKPAAAINTITLAISVKHTTA